MSTRNDAFPDEASKEEASLFDKQLFYEHSLLDNASLEQMPREDTQPEGAALADAPQPRAWEH